MPPPAGLPAALTGSGWDGGRASVGVGTGRQLTARARATQGRRRLSRTAPRLAYHDPTIAPIATAKSRANSPCDASRVQAPKRAARAHLRLGLGTSGATRPAPAPPCSLEAPRGVDRAGLGRSWRLVVVLRRERCVMLSPEPLGWAPGEGEGGSAHAPPAGLRGAASSSKLTIS
jgi:hypothetical protein